MVLLPFVNDIFVHRADLYKAESICIHYTPQDVEEEVGHQASGLAGGLMPNFFLSMLLLGCVEHGNPLYLKQGLILIEARNLKQGRRRIVGTEEGLMYASQLLEVSEVVITGTHKNRDLHKIAHFSTRRLNNRFEIAQNLLILGHYIPRGDDL